MTGYQKYLSNTAVKPFNNNISVLNAGYNNIEKFQHYPSASHPSNYYFSWEEGRVLSEYQVIYITRGQGVFESENGGSIAIKAGSIIILYPDEWHRFKPDINSGWEEYWIGCKGLMLDGIKQQAYISEREPIITIGIQQSVIAIFKEVAECLKKEEDGFQLLASGATLHLLGMIRRFSSVTTKTLMPSAEELVNRAILNIESNLNVNLRLEDIARDLLMSYSMFRKHFKKQTGLSPKQYVLNLLMERAKELLADKSLNINQVAEQLGFNNVFHFSKVFKARLGASPSKYKKSISNL